MTRVEPSRLVDFDDDLEDFDGRVDGGDKVDGDDEVDDSDDERRDSFGNNDVLHKTTF